MTGNMILVVVVVVVVVVVALVVGASQISHAATLRRCHGELVGWLVVGHSRARSPSLTCRPESFYTGTSEYYHF